jgi:hypothetical protein
MAFLLNINSYNVIILDDSEILSMLMTLGVKDRINFLICRRRGTQCSKIWLHLLKMPYYRFETILLRYAGTV